MGRQEWVKTPYAKSTAGRTEEALGRLLTKYQIVEHQWTQGLGPDSRPAMMLRFSMNGKVYRFAVQTLDADATPEELLLQAKRALFYFTKSALEMSSVFFPPEQVMFAFLELPPGPDGQPGTTLYEAAKPQLETGKFSPRLLLNA